MTQFCKRIQKAILRPDEVYLVIGNDRVLTILLHIHRNQKLVCLHLFTELFCKHIFPLYSKDFGDPYEAVL